MAVFVMYSAQQGLRSVIIFSVYVPKKAHVPQFRGDLLYEVILVQAEEAFHPGVYVANCLFK